MEISIKLEQGKISVNGPFKFDDEAGKAEFVNFWRHFITQQVKKIMDNIGDVEFSKIVAASDEVKLEELPADLELQINLDAKQDAEDATKTHLEVNSVTATPDLDDARYLFLLGYVDAAITA
ncbi:hypothetical protein R4B61_03455 [Fructilactobacillus vespulae]|uniref:hypothetical protein n=1 Tax=Fructilactobacillus vespulae TaxID=1249630 RepID=UPI0039B5AC3C